MTRIVTVFGATGTQGSYVVKALLADGIFTRRARSPSGDAAHKLRASGAEVVQGDLWDTASVEQAIAGSEGVFAVTNFWVPEILNGNYEGEVEQGKRIIDACKKAGVKFLVWRCGFPVSMPPKSPKIHHFNTKVKVEEYLKHSGISHAIVYSSWNAENIIARGVLRKNPDESLEFAIPKYNPTALQLVTWVGGSVGPAAAALFKHYEDSRAEVVGQSFVAANARITYPEFAEILSQGKPITVTYLPNAGLEELDEMFGYMAEMGGMYPGIEIPDPRLVKLGTTIGTLTEFAENFPKPHFK